jgi:tRNA(Ile)-lysidine synthetase-like protein
MKHFEYVPKILTFWFPNDRYQEYWFDGSKDEEIKSMFAGIFDKAINDELDEWKNENDSRLALIILLDQFSRSIYRGTPNVNLMDFNLVAVQLASEMLDNDIDLLYHITRRYFILLPLRHQKQTVLLDRVNERLTKYEELEGKSDMIWRFRKATLKDYTKLHDTVKLYSGNNNIEIDNEIILEDVCMKYNDYIKNDIYKNMLNIVLVIMIANIMIYVIFGELQFLLRVMINTLIVLVYNKKFIGNIVEKKPIDNKINETGLYKSFVEFVKENNMTGKNFNVSLSGGVDSMVILYLLNELSKNEIIGKVFAVHIDYANRNESLMEANFLINYCSKLGVPLLIRRVEHMRRNCDDRNFYEKETQQIRFELYKYCKLQFSTEYVCVGHHTDDLAENVFNNMMKGRSILDLTVMKRIMTMYDIETTRPLLGHRKTEVFDLAHRYQIPYFKNTTPTWSNRGILRNEIFPSLTKLFGDFVVNLESIGKQSDEWNNIIEKKITSPLLASVKYGKLGCYFDIELFKDIPLTIWNIVFVKICHNMSLHMITHKNFNLLLEVIEKGEDKVVRLSNGAYCVIEKSKQDNKLIVYVIKELPPVGNIKIDVSNTPITYKINDWSVIIEETLDDLKSDEVTYKSLIDNDKYQYSTNVGKSIETIKMNKMDKLCQVFKHIKTPFRNMIPILESKDEIKSKTVKITVSY